MLYERTTNTFRKIDPAKKFSECTYQEISWDQVNGGDCFKDSLLCIEGSFYLWSGEKQHYYSDPNQKSIIVFKNRAKVIKIIIN